tara:strand:+ start:125 stop:391 length:267 start_codon:yes stop_codon:yes gene_type:complete
MRHLWFFWQASPKNTKIFLTARAYLIVFRPSFRGFLLVFRCCLIPCDVAVPDRLGLVRELRECFITIILKNKKSEGIISNEFAHVAQG